MLFAKLHSDPLLIFLVQLALTLGLTRILGKLFSYAQQPVVIGEIIAGVLMGPSVLGHVPGFTNAVWPTCIALPGEHGPTPGSPGCYDSTVTFNVVADVGIILFMFLLGAELDHHRLQSQWRHALPIALAAIIFPFGVGAATGLWLEDINNEGQPPGFVPPRHRSFMLFSGTAMSFTAFPVLASLLTTLGLLGSPIGLQALSCAAVDDVAAWCTLALASSFAQAESGLQGLYTALGAAAFVAVMIGLVRPLLGRLHAWLLLKHPDLLASTYYTTGLFILLICAAFTTQGLGTHAFFGSFVCGLCVPKTGGFAEALAGRMELVVTEVLLPLFFASSGIKTDIGTLTSWRYWGVTLALVVTASAAKFLPACLTSKALLRQRNWRFCVGIGILMNTRGLVELIALNVGLTMGILSNRTFTMMVLMAICTTWMTGPCLSLLYRGRRHELLGDGLTGSASTAAETLPQPAGTAPDAPAPDPASSPGGTAAAAGARPRPARRTSEAGAITLLYKRGGLWLGDAASGSEPADAARLRAFSAPCAAAGAQQLARGGDGDTQPAHDKQVV